jgi:hypothetical protein
LSYYQGWIKNMSDFVSLVISGLVVVMLGAAGALFYDYIKSLGKEEEPKAIRVELKLPEVRPIFSLVPPQLSTTVSKATNSRMKKIAVYFPDTMVTEKSEARFFFVSVKNLEKSRSIYGLRPAIRIVSESLDKEIWIIEPPSAPKDFITVKWLGRAEEFKAFLHPFANAFTSGGGAIIQDTISLDPEQSKEFLLFFTLKDKQIAFTTVKGGRIAINLPCVFEVQVYYWLKDVGQIEGATIRIDAQNWLFPERDASSTVLASDKLAHHN